MKKAALLSLSFAGALSALAQGTLYFTAHLSGNYQLGGDGTFSLTTNYFSANVQTVAGFSDAQIRSPWPDTNAPVLFNLSLAYTEPPTGGDPGVSIFRGHFTLSDQQIADLESGQWYAFVTGGNPPGSFFLEGQILAVPEPSGWPLSALGLLCFYLFRFRTRTPGIFRRQHEAHQFSLPLLPSPLSALGAKMLRL